MGHKFAERCGHMTAGETAEETEEAVPLEPGGAAGAVTGAAMGPNARRRAPPADPEEDDVMPTGV